MSHFARKGAVLLLTVLSLALAGKLLVVASIALADDEAVTYEAVDLSEALAGSADAGDEDASGRQRQLEHLLHWSISHSDPQALHEAAVEATQQFAVRDVIEQRKRVKELLDHFNAMPTETEVMKETIAVLANFSEPDVNRLEALNLLQSLVEPIDNANDLQPLNGIGPVVDHLSLFDNRPGLAAAAAHVIGTAASNNPTFQGHLLQDRPDVYRLLLAAALHDTQQEDPQQQEELSAKALYALAAMTRNMRAARQAFAAAGGMQALESLLRGSATPLRVKRKALSFLVDLLETAPQQQAAAATHGGMSETASHAEAASEQLGGARAASGLKLTMHDKQRDLGLIDDLGQQPHEDPLDFPSGQPWLGTMEDAGSMGSDAHAAAGQQQRQQHPTAVEDVAGGAGGAADVPPVWGLDAASASVSTGLPEAIVALLGEEDTDTREKTLLAMRAVARDATAAGALRAQGAEEALSALRFVLQAALQQAEAAARKAAKSGASDGGSGAASGAGIGAHADVADEDDDLEGSSYAEYLLGLVEEVQRMLASHPPSSAHTTGSATTRGAKPTTGAAPATARDASGAGSDGAADSVEPGRPKSQQRQQQQHDRKQRPALAALGALGSNGGSSGKGKGNTVAASEHSGSGGSCEGAAGPSSTGECGSSSSSPPLRDEL